MKTTFTFLWGLLFAAILASGCGDGTDAPGSPDTTAAGPVIEDMTAMPRSEAVDTAGVDAAAEGSMAPDFRLPTLGGEPFHLAAHRGEVVLVNFWATWCAPCRIEIPDFIELQEELGDRGLQIVGVSVDAEGAEVVAPFVDQMGINYPVVVDVGEVSEQYGGVYALPTSIIIDRQGRIAHKVPGMLTKDTLRPLLDELLAQEGG